MSDQRNRKPAQSRRAGPSRTPQGLWLLLSVGLVALSLLAYWAMNGASSGQTNGEGQPTFAGLAQLPTSTPTALIRAAAATAISTRVVQPTQAVKSAAAILSAGEADLSIVHTNDVRGYLDPCG